MPDTAERTERGGRKRVRVFIGRSRKRRGARQRCIRCQAFLVELRPVTMRQRTDPLLTNQAMTKSPVRGGCRRSGRLVNRKREQSRSRAPLDCQRRFAVRREGRGRAIDGSIGLWQSEKTPDGRGRLGWYGANPKSLKGMAMLEVEEQPGRSRETMAEKPVKKKTRPTEGKAQDDEAKTKAAKPKADKPRSTCRRRRLRSRQASSRAPSASRAIDATVAGATNAFARSHG